jgi:prepilin-type N-terminal cleavage/methylation domain-containing protein
MNMFRRVNERGMTLIEMLVALVVFSFVLAGALAFLRAQGRSFSLGSQRVAMLQNSRFALDELEKDLRTAGAGAPDIQPPLIYLGNSVLAFNANYLTNTPGDVFAVYYNPDAPNGSTDAVRKSGQFTIPLTAVVYPDTDYLDGGVINSAAETITFYFQQDSSTPRNDDYVLYRQINGLPREVVSRNILQTAGVPFFQYYWLATVAGAPVIQQVANASLPWRHTIPIHLAVSDTGPAAKIDSVRTVQVSFTVTNGLIGTTERKRQVSRFIRLPNVGLASKQTCGDPPIAPTAVTAVWNPLAGGGPGVEIRWSPSTDELAGEKDVERYVIFRKLIADPTWGDPYVSIPPNGLGTPYLQTDQNWVSGAKYFYALAAQDCTPSNSSVVSSLEVDIP